MQAQLRIPTDSEAVTALSVAPSTEDHDSLQLILGPSRWKLLKARDLASALTLLRQHQIAVVICERDLIPGSWTGLLEAIERMPHPPSLIVTSRLADERLWSEVLNRGGWDVLRKPFDCAELMRSIRSASLHWYHTLPSRAKTLHVMKAAS